MWTVSISKGVNASNQKTFTLSYVNGVDTFTETFLWDSAGSAAQMAYGRIQQLTAYDAVVEGPLTPVAQNQ